jgi:hypothetical protein
VRHAVAVAEGVTRGLYEVREWIGPRGDGRFAFGGTIVGEGAAFDAYVGSLGKRVPFAMHAQNAIHYWPVNGRRP